MVPWYMQNKKSWIRRKVGFEQGILHRTGQIFRDAMSIKLYCVCIHHVHLYELHRHESRVCSKHLAMCVTSIVSDIPNTFKV